MSEPPKRWGWPPITLPSESKDIQGLPQQNSTNEPPQELPPVRGLWDGPQRAEAVQRAVQREVNRLLSERSASKTEKKLASMSEGAWLPKNWKEWRHHIVWGVLILGFGLEFVVSILDGHFGRALLALVGLAGLGALLLHEEDLKRRMLTVNPNWVFVSFVLFC